MPSSVDEFKAFVKKYPKLRLEVRDGKRTWQSIFEEWSILGDDGSWDNFKEEVKETTTKTESSEGTEFLKTALNYIKKVNPDDITKVIGTVSKVAGIISAFGGQKNQNQLPGPQRRRVDPLFRRFDDYDD